MGRAGQVLVVLALLLGSGLVQGQNSSFQAQPEKVVAALPSPEVRKSLAELAWRAILATLRGQNPPKDLPLARHLHK